MLCELEIQSLNLTSLVSLVSMSPSMFLQPIPRSPSASQFWSRSQMVLLIFSWVISLQVVDYVVTFFCGRAYFRYMHCSYWKLQETSKEEITQWAIWWNKYYAIHVGPPFVLVSWLYLGTCHHPQPKTTSIACVFVWVNARADNIIQTAASTYTIYEYVSIFPASWC